jgi:hypothetical protein
MPQGDEDAGEVEDALKDGNQAVVANLVAAEVLQPRVGAFDFPAFAVSAQLAFVFKAAMTVVAAVRERSVLCRAFSAVGAADRSHIRDLQSRVADGTV